MKRSWQLSSEKTQDRFPWKFIKEEITEYDICYSNCSVLTLPVFWLFAGSQTVARPHWPTNWEPTSLGAAQSVRTLTSWFVKTFSGSYQHDLIADCLMSLYCIVYSSLHARRLISSLHFLSVLHRNPLTRAWPRFQSLTIITLMVCTHRFCRIFYL